MSICVYFWCWGYFVYYCNVISSFGIAGVDIRNPVLDVTPSPLFGHPNSRGSGDVLSCERLQVSGISRLELGSYASSLRVTLFPSAVIPERLHSKIQVCFHRWGDYFVFTFVYILFMYYLISLMEEVI